MDDLEKMKQIAADTILNMVESRVCAAIIKSAKQKPEQELYLGNNILQITDKDGEHYMKLSGEPLIIRFFPADGGCITIKGE